jgi:NADH:ubiquinone oxidoreductase subunit F (NADH-binding)
MATETAVTARAVLRSVPVVLVAGCLIAAISFGPRSTMGFFLTP